MLSDSYIKHNLTNIQKDLAQIYKRRAEEEQKIESFIEEVYPIINNLTLEDTHSPQLLKTKLKAIKTRKYRELIYVLFRLSTQNAPNGAFITLNINKILQLLNNYKD